jgi:hypothetical protein
MPNIKLQIQNIIRKEPFNEVWLRNRKVFPHSIFRIPLWKCATNERITIKTGEQSLEYPRYNYKEYSILSISFQVN